MIDNPLRVAPLSFDAWVESFTVEGDEDRAAIASAAGRYLTDPVFSRVLSEVECAAVNTLVSCPLDEKKVMEAKFLVHGVRAFRAQMKSWAAELAIQKSKSRQ